FFKKAAQQCGITLGEERDYGVGMFFFPQDKFIRAQAQRMLETLCEKEGLPFLGWREVPVAENVLGSKARDCMPSIWQCFIGRPESV
ncbi:hypothetical protein GUG52_28725, partial [Xanthomonas citri pv. citri]|nr:hypothetical protein [Xanthomonas citri pv. citri]